MAFVRVCVLLFHVKLVHFVHALYFALGPHSLVIVGLQLRSGGDEPPQKIDAESQLGVVKEVLLLAILLLQVVNIALIVVDGSDLL